MISTMTPTSANPTKMMTGGDPVTALPAARLVAWSSGAAALAGLAWFGIALIAGFGSGDALVGLWGAAIAAVAMAVGLLVMAPWIARPISMWMTLWLAGTLVRFAIGLGLSWVLYSATSVSPWALLAGAGGCYVVALVTEVIVLAGFVNRTLAA